MWYYASGKEGKKTSSIKESETKNQNGSCAEPLGDYLTKQRMIKIKRIADGAIKTVNEKTAERRVAKGFYQYLDCHSKLIGSGEHDITILWLTVNRSRRWDSQYFVPLPRAVAKYANVYLEERHISQEHSIWRDRVWNEIIEPEPVLSRHKVENCDVIICDAIWAYMTEEWHKYDQLKALRLVDIHGSRLQKQIRKANTKFGFEVLLAAYYDPFSTLLPDINMEQVIWLPLCISPMVYKDYEYKRLIGCLSTGHSHEKIYPLRHRIRQELKQESFYMQLPLPHEIYTKRASEAYTGKRYAKIINSALMTVSCTSIYNYSILKTFEIPACNSALLSDCTPELKRLGFVPDKNMVEVSLEDRNIKDKIMYWFRRPEELERVTRAGFKLVHRRHTVDVRARQLVTHLRKLLGKDQAEGENGDSKMHMSARISRSEVRERKEMA